MKVVVGLQLAHAVEEIVTEAEKGLFLISPYFRPWPRLETCIKNTAAKGVMTMIIVRREDDPKKDVHIVRAREFTKYGAKAFGLTRLHAKMYANENRILVTSMNLLKSSMEGSWEVGVIYDRDDGDDRKQVGEAIQKLLKDVDAEAKRKEIERKALKATVPGLNPRAAAMQSRAKRARSTKGKAVTARAKAHALLKMKARASTKEGHCIRCSSTIRHNPDRPYCLECYQSWAQYENDEYVEKACHQCGKKSKTSMLKPVCRACYRTQVA